VAVSAAASTGAPRVSRLHLPVGRRTASLLLTAATAAAAVEAFLTFVLAPLRGTFSGEFEDFEAYFQGGRAVADGTNPYAGFDASTVAMSGFDYPPFAAWLVRPIMALPHHWAATLWLWIALAALVAGSIIAARALLPAGWPSTRLAVLAALIYAPATYNLWHGQMNSVVFLLLALAVSDYVAGREIRCGTWIGLAAGIKVAPVLLLFLLVRRGWMRGAVAGGAVGAGTLVVGGLLLGLDDTRQWFTAVLPTLSRDNGWIYNQTWNGVLSRLGDHSVLNPDASALWVKLGATVLGVAGLAAVLWVTRSGYRRTAERGAEFGAAVLAMLLAGSIAWFPHEVHLLIPLFAAAALLAARDARASRPVTAGLAGVVVATGVLAPWAISQLPMEQILAIHGGALWYPFLQATSLPALSSAVLLGALVLALRRGAATPSPAPQ
jgi:alpha-1,2-mannosyltransferase